MPKYLRPYNPKPWTNGRWMHKKGNSIFPFKEIYLKP
jgi:hypothetical protein